MRLMTEELKADVAIPYAIIATPAPGVTSRYFRMHEHCKVTFIAELDTLALADNVVLEVWEALVNTGVGGAAIGGVAPSATCTVVANTNATVITVTVGAGTAVGNTVTIQGVVFTAAAAPVHATQVFDQSSGVAATIATDLAACIANAVSQGLINAALPAGLTVVDDLAAVLTLTVTEAGAGTLTVVSNTAPNLAIATVQAIAYIEVEDTALSAADSWVALNLMGPATVHATVACIRGGPRYEPAVQQVAANDTDA